MSHREGQSTQCSYLEEGEIQAHLNKEDAITQGHIKYNFSLIKA